MNGRRPRLLPYDVIRRASEGDVEAMDRVVRRYGAYMNKLSTQPYVDQAGNFHYVVNEDIRRQLETKLIRKVLLFRATEP